MVYREGRLVTCRLAEYVMDSVSYFEDHVAHHVSNDARVRLNLYNHKTYAVERLKPCNSAIYRRGRQLSIRGDIGDLMTPTRCISNNFKR